MGRSVLLERDRNRPLLFFRACLILILDILPLEMAVGSSYSHGPSGLVHHSCSNA